MNQPVGPLELFRGPPKKSSFEGVEIYDNAGVHTID